MTNRDLPTIEMLHKVLRYEPETGLLFWCERTPDMFGGYTVVGNRTCQSWNTRYKNKEALNCVDKGIGYKRGTLTGRSLLAHRIIWAMVNDEWPPDQIDHINGDKTDNRYFNLRSVSSAENARNQKIRSNNTSGIMGVSLDSNCKIKPWVSQLTRGGKNIHREYFATKERAEAAQRQARYEHGFHKNHGER